MLLRFYAIGPRYHLHQSLRSLRTFSSSSFLAKRVSHGTVDQLLQPPKKPKKSKKIALEHPPTDDLTPLELKQETSGSIVLDTVREYTKKHPLCALLVQVGDFYELYENHATRYASLLDLKLTRKKVAHGQVVDFAGFPSRSLDRYVDILVNRLGCRVALCEQLGTCTRDDGSVLGMQRKITRIITPGTVIEERYLTADTNNYLLAVFPSKNLTHDSSPIGLAWVDLSVGEFTLQQSTLRTFKDDITRIRPREVILPQWLDRFSSSSSSSLDGYGNDDNVEDISLDQDLFDPVTRVLSIDSAIALTYQPETTFDASQFQATLESMITKDDLAQHPKTTTAPLDWNVFSDQSMAAGVALLHYIDQTHVGRRPRLLQPAIFKAEDTLRIDSAAMTSLELLKGLKDGRRQDSLLGMLDHTTTSAGSRLLTQWLSCPLGSSQGIQARLDIVDYFYKHSFTVDDIRYQLKQSSDAQRALQRLAMRRGQYSDLIEISNTLSTMKSIQLLFQQTTIPSPLVSLLATLDPHENLINEIQSAFVDRNSMDETTTTTTTTDTTSDDDSLDRQSTENGYGYVNPNYTPVLRQLYDDLDRLERRKIGLLNELRSICGKSLCLVSQAPYRHVVEVNATPSKKLEAYYQHQELTLVHQTKSKRRYHLSAWTDISMKLDDTVAHIIQIEGQVFEQVVDQLLSQSSGIIRSCHALAQLDTLTTFSWLAKQNNWTRPNINTNQDTTIVGGRHPVVETHLAKKGRLFTMNDCDLRQGNRLWLLTGPNMGGKSTFLRQNAIIVVMAHMGSFVPANRATIGLTDWIFSRVGAADNLAQDQSTFMVEMTETATILKHATSKSLVIMDEVGRGTSTSDGFALAYAILDDLTRRLGCRTLFATHYHELTDAVVSFKDLKCYKTSLYEDQYGFSFLHRVEPGVCKQSHGLKVAQIAGLPSSVVDVARSVWRSLNNGSPLPLVGPPSGKVE